MEISNVALPLNEVNKLSLSFKITDFKTEIIS